MDTCELEYSIQRVCIKLNFEIFNIFFINLLIKKIDILPDDYMRLDLNLE